MTASLPQRPPTGDFLSRELLEALPAAIYTTDAEGRITFYNQSAVELSGRRPELGKDSWCVTWRLRWPDGRHMPHDQCPMAIALRENRPIVGAEAVAERPDGTLIPFLAHPMPLRDASGRLVGAINMLVDIRSRKKAEDALAKRAAEQAALYACTDRLNRAKSLSGIYDAALEAITSALGCPRASVLLFDAAGVMRFVAWKGLSGEYRRAVEGHSPWSPGEADPQPICIGDVDSADLPPDLKATVRAEGIRALSFIPLIAGGKIVGKFMTYYDTPHGFEPDEVELALSIARQVASGVERKRAEETLRDSEERLRAVFDSAAVGAAVLSPGGNFIQTNDALSSITGYPREELQSMDFARLTHPGDVKRTRQAIEELIAGKAPNLTIEVRWLRKNGDLIWVQNSLSLARSATGEPMHLIALSQDITERKKAEDTQRLLIDELNHRVKNTLATIQAIAQQTLRGATSAEQFVANFSGRIQALSRVHTLLSREIWHGADLRELIRDQVLPSSQEKRLSVWGPAVKLEPQIALHLAMVLHELGTNSCKYGALSVPEGCVSVSWKVDGQVLYLCWMERGGPPVEAPPARGFGVLLIEQSVKAHQGTAQMLCEAQGVTWNLSVRLARQGETGRGMLPRTLPADGGSQEKAAVEPDTNLRPPELAGRRVLVVEDEPLVALDLVTTLQDAGAVPIGPAGSTEEALELIGSSELHAALVDGNLKGSPVDEVAAALTQRGVPFAFVTGYGKDGLPRAFQGTPILGKPHSPAALIALTRQLVARRTAVGNTIPFPGASA